MPDLVLDYHRLKTPIDHLDGSITTAKIVDGNVTRAKLEYPTTNVTLAYLGAINKATVLSAEGVHGLFLCTSDSFTDKAFKAVLNVGGQSGTDDPQKVCVGGRVTTHKIYNSYLAGINTSASTADFGVVKYVTRTKTTLGNEAVDLDVGTDYTLMISISGSTIKGFRTNMTTPKVTVTDTSLASGAFGGSSTSSWYNEPQTGSVILGLLLAPSSPLPPAQAILEFGVEGSGRSEDPYRLLMSDNLAPISQLIGLPDFLYNDVKRYDILKAKGFTDDEIIMLFGKIQTNVDLDSVTWGAFELHADKAPTAIVVVTGDNPYKSGAIQRQIDFAKRKNLRVFSPPRDYREATALYNQLERDYPHWLAGKDNFAYQTLGWEILDWMQNIDFYYGELLDHKTHYSQLKQVPDWEITNKLNELIDKLNRETALTDERYKHIAKAKEVLKKGW
jgi:hypothetical protein